MDLKVFWTDTARYQLEDIFYYYKSKASVNVARNMVRQIIDKTLYLEKFPNAGQKEHLLLDRKNNYRYIVEGNYKIIYWIDGGYIKISSVFDTRQNPVRLNIIDSPNV